MQWPATFLLALALCPAAALAAPTAEQLREAAEAGEIETLRALLQQPGADASGLSLTQDLMPDLAMLRLLVERGADPTSAFETSAEGAGVVRLPTEPPQLALLLRVGKAWLVHDISRPGAEEVSLQPGKGVLQVVLRNEMGDRVGMRYFTLEGEPIDLDKLQALRKKHFPHAGHCVWAESHGKSLLFWDIEYRGKPYNCSQGSQISDEDPRSWHIPRYYTLDPKTGKVEMTAIKAKHCRTLLQGGKIACQ